MITLIIMTDGRGEYLSESINSLDNLRGDFTQLVIHDDSGDQAFTDWLRRTYGGDQFTICSTPGRSGFAGAYTSAWSWLRKNCENDWIFFTEDDFVYTRPVELDKMITVMENNPKLVQLALRRQPWNDVEAWFGGIVESRANTYTDKTDGTNHWLEHRNFFTTNPSLIRTQLIHDRDWIDEPESEGKFGWRLYSETDSVAGFWGSRESGEWCFHIGKNRIGTGY